LEKPRTGRERLNVDPLRELTSELRKFARERRWTKYHSPKNLAMALAVEAAELMEIFQWLSPGESRKLKAGTIGRVEEEIGDVLIYLIRLADRLAISPVEAAKNKMEKNKAKYPVEKARGNPRKYNEF
jgi:NTP pyrophosphatase (non-canonical NTP hydrolase)